MNTSKPTLLFLRKQIRLSRSLLYTGQRRQQQEEPAALLSYGSREEKASLREGHRLTTTWASAEDLALLNPVTIQKPSHSHLFHMSILQH